MSDETNKDEKKVIRLEEKLKKKKNKEEEKLARAELFQNVAMAMNEHPLSMLPEFDRRFHVVEPEPGIRHILEEKENGIVSYVNLNAVINSIALYTTEELAERKAFCWTARTCKEAAEFWLAIAKPIKEPPPFLWADEEGLCFHRLPWKYAPDFDGDKTPLFNEMMSRISNHVALMHWIGSLFDLEADRQQYVWLYGQGGNGKSALARFISNVFGRACGWQTVPGKGREHFWTMSLQGKRLIIFGDCNNASFPASGFFKSLTGGDLIRMEPKGKEAFSAEIFTKFLFLSNERPNLSSEYADLRRAIYCEMEPIPNDPDPTYEERLWEEGGAFLSTCIHNYRLKYPRRGSLKADFEELKDVISANEETFEVCFEKHFEVDQEDYVSPKIMQDVLRHEGFIKTSDQKKFIDWMMRNYDVKKKSIKREGLVSKGYRGVKVKGFFSRNGSV